MTLAHPCTTLKSLFETSIIFHVIETSPTSALECKQYLILQDFNVAAPFRLFLHISFLYVHLSKKKISIASYQFGILFSVNKINVILIAPGCWGTAMKSQKLEYKNLPRTTDDTAIYSRC